MTTFEENAIERLAALGERLAELGADVRGVKEEVKRQNGNVARVTESAANLSERLSAAESCQWHCNGDALTMRIAAIEMVHAVDAAAEKTDLKWHRRIDPAWGALALLLVFLALEHADKLKALIFK